MEYKYIVLIAFVAIVVFLIIAITLGVISDKKQKANIASQTGHYGKLGEDKVDETLDSLDKNIYHVYKNVMFRTRDGMTHEIDNVVVSKYGIYVIEVKNWAGKISGTESDNYWTKGNCYGVKNLKNPVKQNKVHVESLKSILDLKQEVFFPIVCFVRLDDDSCINTSSLVVSLDELIDTLDKNKLKKPMKDEVVIDICKVLDQRIKKDKVSNKEHVKNINKKH